MTVDIYSKPNCGICKSAKQKLDLLKVAYVEHDVTYHTTLHPGWRDDGSTDVLAAYALYGSLPLIRVDGTVLDYTGAIKALRQPLRAKSSAPEPALETVSA